MEKPATVKATQHESYNTYTLIAFILPVVGVILGIAYLAKDQKLDRKLGEHLVAISILFGILWLFVFYVLLPMMGFSIGPVILL